MRRVRNTISQMHMDIGEARENSEATEGNDPIGGNRNSFAVRDHESVFGDQFLRNQPAADSVEDQSVHIARPQANPSFRAFGSL